MLKELIKNMIKRRNRSVKISLDNQGKVLLGVTWILGVRFRIREEICMKY